MAVLVALLVPIAASFPAIAAAPCSSDVFAIDGNSVTVALCVAPPTAGAKSAVTERVTVRGQPPLERDVTIDRVPGSETAHMLDDLSLETLGISRTLHLTIALRGSTAHLEHALLIPGATALK